MKTLNDVNQQLAKFGRIKRLLSLEFHPELQWLAILMIMAGYWLSPSTYLEISTIELGGWISALMVALILIVAGVGVKYFFTWRKTRPVAARWCCLAVMATLWLPSVFIIDGLPTLITQGIVLGMTLMASNVACKMVPIKSA
ncbi:hypothetical protein V0M98_38045 (plasmid) [Pseudomonas silesiensis]|uniref:hypothetical protein n=1 Tax=Pseudomonas silesiensis TaxID=1853130 RepID=UPI0030CF46FE